MKRWILLFIATSVYGVSHMGWSLRISGIDEKTRRQIGHFLEGLASPIPQIFEYAEFPPQVIAGALLDRRIEKFFSQFELESRPTCQWITRVEDIAENELKVLQNWLVRSEGSSPTQDTSRIALAYRSWKHGRQGEAVKFLKQVRFHDFLDCSSEAPFFAWLEVHISPRPATPPLLSSDFAAKGWDGLLVFEAMDKTEIGSVFVPPEGDVQEGPRLKTASWRKALLEGELSPDLKEWAVWMTSWLTTDLSNNLRSGRNVPALEKDPIHTFGRVWMWTGGLLLTGLAAWVVKDSALGPPSVSLTFD